MTYVKELDKSKLNHQHSVDIVHYAASMPTRTSDLDLLVTWVHCGPEITRRTCITVKQLMFTDSSTWVWTVHRDDDVMLAESGGNDYRTSQRATGYTLFNPEMFRKMALLASIFSQFANAIRNKHR